MAAVVCGVVATLVGVIVLGPGATLDYVGVLRDQGVSAVWDNASLPAAAARLFTENPYAQNVVTLPWVVPVGYALGLGAIVFSAMRVSHDPEVGLWVLVAASLLASPIAWHNYLVLLGPGILLLLARGMAAPAFLLLALQVIPAQWPLIWNQRGTVVASVAMTLYLFILIAHWLALLAATREPEAVAADSERRALSGIVFVRV